MLFVYIDDILAPIHEITEFYKAKEGSVKPPVIYLGANVSKMQLPDAREVWTALPMAYMKNSFVVVVEQLLSEDGDGYVLKSKI
jgi:hypothetical protein